MDHEDEVTEDERDREAEFAPLKPDNPPGEADDMGHWVRDEYGWRYELSPIGLAIMAEEQRLEMEAMADAHHAGQERMAAAEGVMA